ncbi:hypothetical protein D3C87_1254240 [compost metagenome]
MGGGKINVRKMIRMAFPLQFERGMVILLDVLSADIDSSAELSTPDFIFECGLKFSNP